MYEQPFNPFIKNQQTVKDYCKSPVVLSMGIVRIVSAVLAVVSAVLISTQMPAILDDVKELLLQFCQTTGVPLSSVRDFYTVIDGSSQVFTAGSIPSILPSVLITCLIAAAFFIIYFKSRNSDPTSTPSAGVTILYVFAIIEMIAIIIITVAVVAGFVLLFWLYFQMKSATAGLYVFTLDLPFLNRSMSLEIYPGMLLAIIIAGLIVAAICIFLALFYVINKKRFFGSIRSSMNSVELQTRGAKPYGVMCVIGAFFSGLSLLSIPSLFIFGNGRLKVLVVIGIVSALSSIASFVTVVLEAKFALGYKNYIDGVKYGYMRHGESDAPYSPYPAGGYNAPQSNPYVNAAPPVNPMPTAGYGFGPANDTNPYSAQTYDAPSADNAYSDPYGYEAPSKADPYAAEPTDDAIPSVDKAFAAFDDEPAPEAESETSPEAAAVCPSCGAELEPGSAFCGNCGTKL